MEQEQIKALKLFLNLQAVIMQIDDMEGGNAWRHELKRKANPLRVYLEKQVDQVLSSSDKDEADYWQKCSYEIYSFIEKMEVKIEVKE
jgi:transketolase